MGQASDCTLVHRDRMIRFKVTLENSDVEIGIRYQRAHGDGGIGAGTSMLQHDCECSAECSFDMLQSAAHKVRENRNLSLL